MGRKTEETTIGHYRVMSEQLPALDALAVVPKLGKIIASAVSKLEGVGLEDSLTNLEISTLAPAITELFAKADEENITEITQVVLQSTVVVNKELGEKYELTSKERISAAFAGDLSSLIKTLAWVIKFNFADFFGGDLLSKARAMGQTPATENPSN